MYANERNTGGDRFSVRVYPPSGAATSARIVNSNVVDNSDDTYSADFTVFTTGASQVLSSLMHGQAGGVATALTLKRPWQSVSDLLRRHHRAVLLPRRPPLPHDRRLFHRRRRVAHHNRSLNRGGHIRCSLRRLHPPSTPPSPPPPR
jgi:hypothetical protein